MRRTLIVLAATALVISALAAPALAWEVDGDGLAPQPRAAKATPQDGPVHLALGDSVAAGSGATNPQLAYVPRLAHKLTAVDCREGQARACPHLELQNISVGGAKSQDLIDEQLEPALAEITRRLADGDPSNDVEFITLTIGGNDVFRPVIAACSGGVTPECMATIESTFGTYQANLAQILGSLRATAHGAEIAIMTYDNPLAGCYLSDLAPLADVVLEGNPAAGLPGGLNDIIRGVAHGVGGITVVETYGLLGDGDFVGGDDCLHPDDSGHRKIADAYWRALREA